MRVEPTQARGIATKARIVNSTKAIYQSDGRDRLTTEAVAAHAGVAVGTLYRYFEDRVDLLDAAYPNRDRELLDKFLGELKDVYRTHMWLSDDMAADEYILGEDVDKLIEKYSDNRVN